MRDWVAVRDGAFVLHTCIPYLAPHLLTGSLPPPSSLLPPSRLFIRSECSIQLMRNGADIDQKNKDGKSPLSWSEENKEKAPHLVELLNTGGDKDKVCVCVCVRARVRVTQGP